MYVLNHRDSPKWISAVVAKSSGPLSLVVKFPDGREARYHVDHVKARATRGTVEDGEDCDPFAGEAENDNDQVPKVPIIVEEPAGDAPEEPQAPEVPEPLTVLLCQHSADHCVTVPRLIIMGLGLSEGECSILGSIGQW